jgi:uncharacterized protein YlxW (UPF0749 family)
MTADPGAETGVSPEPVPTGGRARWRSLLTPRLRRVDVAVAVLLAALGFAAVVQVRSTQVEGPLATARQEDLVQILDDLTNRDERLQAEIGSLEQARREITSGSGRSEAALAEARRRTQLLGVLAGTVPARGPGLMLTISDPRGEIGQDALPDVLLNALEELRAAGAEAVQLEGPVAPGEQPAPGQARVRVVASTSFLRDDRGGVLVDGQLLKAPFRFLVVGEPTTLATSLVIPGGVVDDVEARGGETTVERSGDVLVGALRPLEEPRYARPAA